MNKIKILHLIFTMIYCYVVEYQFHGVMSSIVKRQRFSSTDEGLSLAIQKYISEVEYIDWERSEDFEQVELKAVTHYGEILKWHYDTVKGTLINPNYYNEVYNCYG